MKIANKISLSFLSTALILTCTATPIFYLTAKSSLQKSIYNNLSMEALSRSRHIETYLKMLKVSVGQLSKSSVLEDFLKVKNKDDGAWHQSFEVAQRRLRRTRAANPSIAEFLLLDKTGMIVLSSNDSSIGIDKSSDSFFLGAQKESYLKDIYYSEVYKEPLMAVSAPLLDSQTGELLGVLAARARLADLNSILTERTGMGDTGETYIVNRYGYMVTPSRFKEDAVLKQKVGIQYSRERPVSIYSDYRGARVLGAHEYIPQMQWQVLAEIDTKEAFAPLGKLLLIFYLIIIIVPILGWLSGVYLAALITGSLHKLHKGAEIIGGGNLDYKVGMNTKDEVGQLSRAFDEMVENLKKSTTSIEKLNKEINERKLMEKSLQESKERYRSLFVSSRDAIMTLEPPDWKFASANPATIEMFNAKNKNEFLLYEPWRLSPELQPDGRSSGEKAKEMIEKAMREGANSFEWVHQRLSGEVFFAEVSLSRVALGEKVYLQAVVKDITEHKKSEEQIKKQNLFVESIINSLQYPLYVVDTNYNIILSNKAAGEIGIANGGHCYELTHHRQEPCSGEHACPLKEVIRTGKSIVLEHIHFDQEGNSRNFEVHGDPILDKDGKVIQMVEYSIDITERKKAEAALMDAMKAKSDFTSTVSHELRTPLTAIREGVSLVLDGTAGQINEEQKDFLSLAKRNVDRLGRLINDVLDLQKLEAQKMVFNIQENDINELLKEVYNTMLPLTDKRGLELTLKLEEGLPRVKFDRDRIIQVLTNLVNNAIKFTEKGSIVVTSGYTDNVIQVGIKDSGPGIKKEDMDKLFQQFRQLEKLTERKTGGTGLGLAISKEIIDRHKGRIWAESEFGKGTAFYFILPVKVKEKVLVIDDEKSMLDIIKNFLEKKDYAVTCSEKGLEAMEIIGGDKPDLVILDMRLQDTSGYEIIGRLRSNKETSDIPIIGMSGYPEELTKIEDKQKEFALVSIAKPFDLENLLSIARRLLQQRL
ncbi:MAG TPA: ATP-binding protein [Candidatus Margulisiibacteriota bacterium]|nr:ATP-binding protein [Candidatus Margulisiibacteriota bacterium]